MLAPHCLSLAMNNSKRTRPHHEPRAALGLQSSSASPVDPPTTPHAVETRRPRMSSSTTTGREPALTEGPPAGRFLTQGNHSWGFCRPLAGEGQSTDAASMWRPHPVVPTFLPCPPSARPLLQLPVTSTGLYFPICRR